MFKLHFAETQAFLKKSVSLFFKSLILRHFSIRPKITRRLTDFFILHLSSISISIFYKTPVPYPVLSPYFQAGRLRSSERT